MSKNVSPAEELRIKLERELKSAFPDVDDSSLQKSISEVPRKWERHGDLLLLPQNSFRNDIWERFGKENLYNIVCCTLHVKRLARKNHVRSDTFRSSSAELLWGNDPMVSHVDNKIKYQWDLTKCMFSIGNITEKLRVAAFKCENEVVVDLFAGIGYFVLPYLIHAKAKHVHACEINPHAIKALKMNLSANKVRDRCTIHEGDNRLTCPSDVADRVNLGLIPSSEMSWETACKALKSVSGGMLHIHANVDSKKGERKDDTIFKYPEWETWAVDATDRIVKILREVKCNEWNVKIVHLEHVKSYAPRVDHLVLDLHCTPINIEKEK